MTQRSHVPKFGNWDSEEDVPYTAYFDKARKDKNVTGTKMINPNDPQQNPDLLREDSSSVRSTQRGKSREDNEFRNYIKSPARNGSVGNRFSNEFQNQRPGTRGVSSAENYRRTAKHSVGSDQSIGCSPLHQKASPSWEGKNFYGSSYGTPGRSQLRPSNEMPDRAAAVPKFGEWDESNPASADGYTHIFNTVRKERLGGVASSPSLPSKAPYPTRKQSARDTVWCCCFGIGGK